MTHRYKIGDKVRAAGLSGAYYVLGRTQAGNGTIYYTVAKSLLKPRHHFEEANLEFYTNY